MAGIGREEYSRDLLMVSVSPRRDDGLIFLGHARESCLFTATNVALVGAGLTAIRMEYVYPKHSLRSQGTLSTVIE